MGETSDGVGGCHPFTERLKQARAGREGRQALGEAGEPATVPQVRLRAGSFTNPAVGKAEINQDDDALVMELATGALKLSPWDGEIFTAALVPNGPLAAVAENLGPQPLSFAQFQMDATGALNVLRLTTSDGQTFEFRRE